LKSLSIDNISSALKTTPDILGKDKYLNSAVLIPLFEKDSHLHVLFEKRAIAIRQGGEVSFPGGEFDSEKDCNLNETALRETTEELGVESENINVLGKLGTHVAPMGVTVDAYVGYLNINDISTLRFDKVEVERIFSFPLEYFINNKPDEYYVRLEVHPFQVDDNGNQVELLPVSKLGLPEKYAKPWKNGRHRILVYKTPEEIIWGITAEIIYEFIKVINKYK
jgi:8-oxo-dGTP pyrophosphatase MutT (NUDIX family)